MTMDAETQVDASGEEATEPRSPRKPNWKLIISIGAVAALAIAGGVWLGYDLSQRRDVPDFAGLTLEEAKAAASDADLSLDVTIAENLLDLNDENTIVSEQGTAPGSVLKAGDSMSVTVLGRDARVPDLVGLSYEEAEDLIAEAQFVLAHDFDDNRPPNAWPIISQGVAASKMLASGSELKLRFEVPEIVMPALAGAEVGEAESELTQLGLLPEQDEAGTHVASTSIEAGTVLEPFTNVVLTLGYSMPNVVGKTHSEAKEMLSAFSNVTFDGHSARPITAQSVRAGTVVSSEAAVTITSPGPETIYRIIGNGYSASVTWAPPGSFSIQQANETSLPWVKSFPRDSGISVLSAQVYGGDSITCQIERNGKVIREATSTGAYAVVTCELS